MGFELEMMDSVDMSEEAIINQGCLTFQRDVKDNIQGVLNLCFIGLEDDDKEDD